VPPVGLGVSGYGLPPTVVPSLVFGPAT